MCLQNYYYNSYLVKKKKKNVDLTKQADNLMYKTKLSAVNFRTIHTKIV